VRVSVCETGVALDLPPHPVAASSTETAAKPSSCSRPRRPDRPGNSNRLRKPKRRVAKIPAGNAAIARFLPGGVVKGAGRREAWLVVWRVTVAVATAFPLGVRDEGETLQVVLAMAPVHVSVAGWLKPPLGVRVRVVETELPGVTEDVDEERPMVKLGVAGAEIVTEIAADVEGEKTILPEAPG